MIKKYFFDLYDVFDIRNIIIESIIFSFLIIWIDILNLLTWVVTKGFFFLIILLFLIICIKLISNKNLNLVISKNINIFDKYLIMMFIIIGICLIYILFFDYKFYKLILLFCFYVETILLFYVRGCSFSGICELQDVNIYDLKTLCEQKVILSNNKTLFLDENAVNYDLLNRNKIINQLYNTILYCMPRKNFTIGLNGKWGSGKTTIVECVMKLLEDNNQINKYLVVNFDPWQYDDEKAILKGFVNKILENITFDFGEENIDDLVSELINSIFYDNNIFNFNLLNKIKTANKIKLEKVVNNYLKSNNKRMLLIMDNLDRVDSEKVMLLLKILETVTNFEQSIYLILYDEEILSKMFKKMFDINGNFIEKIIELKIDMPEISTDSVSLLLKKVSKNIVLNDVPFLDFDDNLNYNFSSVRSLKRFLNSILSSNVNISSTLNRKDESCLEYIKAVNSNLYYEIWEHKDYFISFDRHYDNDLHNVNYDKLNIASKEYFNELFSNPEYEKLKSHLCFMFPTVDNYFKKYDSFDSRLSGNKYKNSVVNKRISNTRYFDLYFTGEENDFIRLDNSIDKLIKNINHKRKFYKIFKDTITKYNFVELKVFVELLELNIDKIDLKKKKDLIVVLLKLQNEFDDTPFFLSSDSSTRVNIIIAELLSYISKEEFEELEKIILNDFKNLWNYESILYWINHNKSSNKIYNFDFELTFKSLCNNVLENDINLFLKDNYFRKNIWSLYHYDKESTKKYFKNYLKKENIFKILSSFISTSVGTRGYGYSISKENVESFLSENEFRKYVDNYLKSFNNLSDKELFVKSVYEIYKNPYKESVHDDAVYSKEPVNINID